MPNRLSSIAVIVATLLVLIFNWLAATGHLFDTRPDEISDRFQTIVTPAGYAFSIWSLIYLGIVIFSFVQFKRPIPNAVRTLYLTSCLLNCIWIYCWHSVNIIGSFFVILLLCLNLFAINLKIRDLEGTPEKLFVRGTFGLYGGWVTAATLVNFAVLLTYLGIPKDQQVTVGVFLILLSAVLGVVFAIKLRNHIFPVAIAWALTAIAVKQSGATLIVSAAAVGVVACLIAALSFVLGLTSRTVSNE